MPLSQSVNSLLGHYKVVIVGSGYGGGIAASRLARAGQTVCVLERGKEFLPGQFPTSSFTAASEVQLQTSECYMIGDASRLYDFYLGPDISVLRASGLGGTSLINAGVVIEADKRVFEEKVWPEDLRKELTSEEFNKYYDQVRIMLGAAKYPTESEDHVDASATTPIAAPGATNPAERPKAYLPLAKNSALKKAAGEIEDGPSCFHLVDIAVNFKTHPTGVNHVGVPQVPCNNCGDCTTGCNFTSKNTVQMTYLPDAYNHGANIFTGINVTHLTRNAEEGGWTVHFELLGSGREAFSAPPMFVKADLVVLSAGSLGSTEILLRSKMKGLPLSNALGTHFSGNGDAFGFAYTW